MATIFVIDDDPQMLSLLRSIWEAMGHRVLGAGNGSEGFDLFHQRRIELVVTSVFTPENDGLEVIMTLCREAPTVPIIGFSDRAVRYKMLNAAKKHDADRSVGNTFLVADSVKLYRTPWKRGSPKQEKAQRIDKSLLCLQQRNLTNYQPDITDF